MPSSLGHPFISFPPSIDWWVTSKCNLSCDYCYGPRPDDSENNYIRNTILRAICRSGAQTVTLCGGEPLLLEKLSNITTILAAFGKAIILNTNGELLDKMRVAELRIGKDVRTVGIALDGSDSAMHADMRGHNSNFDKTLTAARLVKSIPGVHLKIATVLSAVNCSEVLSIGELVNRLCPSTWRIYQYTPREHGALSRQKHELSDSDFAKAIREVKVRYPKRRISACTRIDTTGCFLIDHKGNIIQPMGISYHSLGSCLVMDIDETWRKLWRDKDNVVQNKIWLSYTEYRLDALRTMLQI